MVEVGFSGLLFFGSFDFVELDRLKAFLGSFGGAKEMNIIPKNEKGCPYETPSGALLAKE